MNSTCRQINATSLLKMGLVVFSILFLSVSTSRAEVINFGGFPEKFRGAGDKEPPQCQIDIPRSATSPFFIQWNCVDNFAEQENIRSELWVYRKNSEAPVLVRRFLGFPASVFVDEGILGIQSSTDGPQAFTEGLPASFRLIASDRAGISVISPFFTVLSQDNAVNVCTLRLETKATASTGGTTGLPALTVLAQNVSVESQQFSEITVRIFTPKSVVASPCEVDSICDDNNEIDFESSVSIDSAGRASGVIEISPGSTTANLTGTGRLDGSTLTSLELTGVTAAQSATANISLSCSP